MPFILFWTIIASMIIKAEIELTRRVRSKPNPRRCRYSKHICHIGNNPHVDVVKYNAPFSLSQIGTSPIFCLSDLIILIVSLSRLLVKEVTLTQSPPRFDSHPTQRYTISVRGCAVFRLGGMAEWTMAVVLKTTVAAMSPGVRIPLPPPNASGRIADLGRSHSSVECARLLSG